MIKSIFGFKRLVSSSLIMLLLAGALASVLPQKAQAVTVGISPPVVNRSNILANTSQQVKVRIFRDWRNINDGDAIFKVEPRGEFASSISGPQTLTIPQGNNYNDYFFNIDSQNLNIGNYNVFIDFLQQANVSNNVDDSDINGADVSAKVNIIAGTTLTVRFAVIEQEVLDYNLYALYTRYQKNSNTDKNLIVNYIVHNTGNIAWHSEKIELTLTNTLNNNSENVKILIDKDNIMSVEPGDFKMFTINVELPLNLPNASYDTQAKFYNDNQEVTDEILSRFKFRAY